MTKPRRMINIWRDTDELIKNLTLRLSNEENRVLNKPEVIHRIFSSQNVSNMAILDSRKRRNKCL